jgi:hypothetical protein
METQSGMSSRVDRLEEQAEARHVRAVAGRLAALVGCDPDQLLAEAERDAELIEAHGRERTIEIIAERVGLTPEQLEDGAARLAAAVA